MTLFEETATNLYELFTCNNQNWFFGAGISAEANIPLMKTLTKRVEDQLKDDMLSQYTAIKDTLNNNYHIEHVLSQIGDLNALLDRTQEKKLEIKGFSFEIDKIKQLYKEIIIYISTAIRYGYIAEDATSGTTEKIGDIRTPITNITNHRDFIKTLISIKSNLLTRSSISFFTTNYDTLLEDALALENIAVNDGFSGSAIGFWNPEHSFSNAAEINIFKLHGSVDWIKNDENGLIRNRYGVNYIKDLEDVLIYPQATKYIEAQKDPFALIFSKLRERLNTLTDNLLICLGYSFGDDHINLEIENALLSSNNKTTIIIFINELNEILVKWINNVKINKRIYVATKEGIYHESSTIISDPLKTSLNWWKFSSFIEYLKNGDIL